VNKTLRIFAKDVRHLWPEILVSLVLTAGFAATDHYWWARVAPEDIRRTLLIRATMEFLMPLGWVMLIVRAVQDESLVGDRQFWITRPYGWQRVLAAKLLFIAAFICIPLALVELFLLHQAGLHPTLVVPGLLLRFCFFCGFILIPLVAFSAITPTVTRMFMVLLAAVGYIVLAAYLFFAAFPRPVMVPGNGGRGAWIFLLIPITGVVIILLQYIRRSTRTSIVLLASAVLIMTAGVMTASYTAGDVRGYAALAAGEAAPLSAALDPNPIYQADKSATETVDDGGPTIAAAIPLAITGVAPGKAITIEGAQIAYEADGKTSELPWSGGDNRFYTVGEPNTHEIFLTHADYKKLRQQPFVLHITLAVIEYGPDAPQKVWFDGKTMDTPDNGHCRIDPGTTDLQCQYALSLPGPTTVSWHQQENCSVSGPLDTNAARWAGRWYEGNGIQPELSPVEHLSPVKFNRPTMASFAPVCPATWFTFTKYHVARKRLVQVTLPSVDVTLYRFPHNNNE